MTKQNKYKLTSERVQECIEIRKKLNVHLLDKNASYNKEISDCMNRYIKGETIHKYIKIPELNKTLELGLANVFLQENLVVLRNRD